jgi:purine-binding chemotaxis protein CheW
METEDINRIKAEDFHNDEILQLVSFNVGAEEFAINILNVQEINRIVDITRVPNSPNFIIGVINLRGKVIPIIDLRMRLGLETIDNDKNTRIIVFEFNSKILGFVVDQVNEVIRINTKITEAPPTMVAGVDRKFITSIAKLKDRLLILLDLEKIIVFDAVNKDVLNL